MPNLQSWYHSHERHGWSIMFCFENYCLPHVDFSGQLAVPGQNYLSNFPLALVWMCNTWIMLLTIQHWLWCFICSLLGSEWVLFFGLDALNEWLLHLKWYSPLVLFLSWKYKIAIAITGCGIYTVSLYSVFLFFTGVMLLKWIHGWVHLEKMECAGIGMFVIP